MNKVLAALLVLSFAVLPAAAAEVCAGVEARAFDFWIGDWAIEQKILQQDGSWLELPAQTSVAPALDGCALVEHWKGEVQFFWEGMEQPQPMKGLSVRAYDPEAGVWRIHWMDTRSPRFSGAYEGNFADGRGEFFRRRQRPQGTQLNRITFADITEGSVRWELAVSNDDAETWTTIWIMNMRRAAD